MSFVNDQGKEALNFAITITMPVLVVIDIGSLVLVIMAAVKASEGVAYRYLFAIRLAS